MTQEEAVTAIRQMLEHEDQHHVATPNNEMLVAGAYDPQFRAVLNRTTLNLSDSTGVVWAARLLRYRMPERVTGVDTVAALCRTLDRSCPVFLLGAAPGVAERAAVTLCREQPKLCICGTYAGSPCEEDAPTILARIRAAAPRLLLVAYGAPAQDLWIARHLPSLPSVRVAMGVGGTFDFLAGHRSRAPTFIRRAGFEWLWRLLQEPRRLPRIFTALVAFPLLVLRFGQRVPRSKE